MKNSSITEGIQYLKKQPPGGFIVRTSSRYPGFYGLSIKTKEHENNNHCNGKFIFIFELIYIINRKGKMFPFQFPFWTLDFYFKKYSRFNTFVKPLKSFQANFGKFAITLSNLLFIIYLYL